MKHLTVELIAQVRLRNCLGLLALRPLPHPPAEGEGKEEVPMVGQAATSRAKSTGDVNFPLQRNIDLWGLAIANVNG